MVTERLPRTKAGRPDLINEYPTETVLPFFKGELEGVPQAAHRATSFARKPGAKGTGDSRVRHGLLVAAQHWLQAEAVRELEP